MKKVMIVDDSRFMREEISHILSGTEYEVCAGCRDAEEAMQAYAAELPDLVLMDIILPGIDGIDATKCIIAKWPEARVVMVSSLAYDEDMELAQKIGAKSYLVKPFSQEDLLRALQEAEM